MQATQSADHQILLLQAGPGRGRQEHFLLIYSLPVVLTNNKYKKLGVVFAFILVI